MGRFAPSPTGPLHSGSLFSALASYVDAKANNGKWLVRIEDHDHYRSQPGAAKSILNTLETYGLYWDDQVLYQSTRKKIYEQYLDKLAKKDLIYACTCSRRRLRELPTSDIYPGLCRDLGRDHFTTESAIRLKVDNIPITYNDRLHGTFSENLTDTTGDFIIKRRDKAYAYQLAVVIDDAEQAVSHVVRGTDLLDSTARQCYLQYCFGFIRPLYLHTPVLCGDDGRKLSKQNHSPSVPLNSPSQLLMRYLNMLNQMPPNSLSLEKPEEILAWAIKNWNYSRISKELSIPWKD